MKKVKVIVIMVILSIAFSGYAQDVVADAQSPFIEATGTAEKEIVPDEIYISITIKEKYQGKDKVTIESQEQKLKDALKSINIDLSNLSLSNAYASYSNVKWFVKDVLTQKNYSLKVSDADAVTKVYKELEKLEIMDAYIAKVSHSKIDSLRKDVRIKAIKAAKEKADYLLAAIGEQVGKPLVVKEIENANNYYSNYSNGRMNYAKYKIRMEDGFSVEDEENIQFQKITIKTTIYVKFSIK